MSLSWSWRALCFIVHSSFSFCCLLVTWSNFTWRSAFWRGGGGGEGGMERRGRDGEEREEGRGREGGRNRKEVRLKGKAKRSAWPCTFFSLSCKDFIWACRTATLSLSGLALVVTSSSLRLPIWGRGVGRVQCLSTDYIIRILSSPSLGAWSCTAIPFCCMRLLVFSVQLISLQQLELI